MSQPKRTLADFAAAALIAQLFNLYLLVMVLLAPPTKENWARADPILLLLPGDLALWSVPTLGVVTAVAWYWLARPSRENLLGGLRYAAAGALLGCLITSLLRLILGPHLPSFIPAEENAGPGVTLSMTAGFAEEVICRLMLLPLAFFFLAPRIRQPVAVAVAVIGTGAAFALLHHPSWEMHLMATRFLLPGCAMSLAALLISPAFIVSLHCAAHLLLPVLFLGADLHSS